MAEGSRDLDQFIHVATSIYYNRDFKKEKKKDLEKEKKKDKWQEALIAVLRGFPRAKFKPEDMLSMWTGKPF
jgi:hypothetical protein